jgi:ribosomal protein S18 acetylase RimI-like enzyme
MAGFIALRDRHIDQLYVDPSCQRCGIGSALLDRALASAPGRATLDVFEDNSGALAFYEKRGFRQRDRWMNNEEGAIDLLYVRDWFAARAAADPIAVNFLEKRPAVRPPGD